jgi:hypothetical protein
MKVKYHWHKARWHETKMPLGLSQGIIATALVTAWHTRPLDFNRFAISNQLLGVL